MTSPLRMDKILFAYYTSVLSYVVPHMGDRFAIVPNFNSLAYISWRHVDCVTKLMSVGSLTLISLMKLSTRRSWYASFASSLPEDLKIFFLSLNVFVWRLFSPMYLHYFPDVGWEWWVDHFQRWLYVMTWDRWFWSYVHVPPTKMIRTEVFR